MKAALGLALLAATAAACADAEASQPEPAPGENRRDIACGDERVLLESRDGRPACVTPDTAQKLLERGWGETARPGSGAAHAQTMTVTARTGSWTMAEGNERVVSEIIDHRPYTPCHLPSSISVEVPVEAAVGVPFDVTITPSFEMTPQQIEDYNDLYGTDFESARDMWESVCDSERASYYIKTPATYRPSGDNVSHVWTKSSKEYYPTFNHYTYHVDRKIEFAASSTTVQMTIDEPVVFRMSDINDRSNQDYFKFDFGYFWVDASTLPIDDLGPPLTFVYTDITGDQVRFSDTKFARVQGSASDPGPDDQLIPRTADQVIPLSNEVPGTALLRPVQDGETMYRDFPFWLIAEHPSWRHSHDDGPVATIDHLGLGEEYLAHFLDAYPQYRSSTRVSGASAMQSELPDSSLPEDHGVSGDVPFEWIAELLEGDFRGEDPAELIKRFGLDDAYVSQFLDAYPQYNTRASSAREHAGSKTSDAAVGAQSSQPNLAFVIGKAAYSSVSGTTTAIHGVKACAYDASDGDSPTHQALFNGRRLAT